MRLKDLKLTLLFDNIGCNPRLERLWGFSCLIETPKVRLLLDTGSNGRLLLRNMQRLGLNPADLNALFITHGHWDHIGGLDSILEQNPTLELTVPASLSQLMVNDLRTLCKKVTVVGNEPESVGPDLASTGTLPADIAEQALVISTDQGIVVITGCAHPGISTIAELASRQTGAPVVLLAGGFHLLQEEVETIDQICDRLQDLGVEYILPTHCTGASATARLQERYSERFVPGGVGQIITFDTNGRLIAEIPNQREAEAG